MTYRPPLFNQDIIFLGSGPDSVDGKTRLDEAGVPEGGEGAAGVRLEGVEEHRQTRQVPETKGWDQRCGEHCKAHCEWRETRVMVRTHGIHTHATPSHHTP